jgi:hypothetical protein
MQLVEAIEKHAPEAIKRYIPLKATSLDQFIAFVKNNGGTVVQAEPEKTEVDGSHSWAVGNIGNSEYSTRYTSRTTTGRKIVFNEVHLQKFGSEFGFADAQDRNLIALRGLITAESRLREIKKRLPNVETLGPTHKMDETTQKEMWLQAKVNKVKPFPKARQSEVNQIQ